MLRFAVVLMTCAAVCGFQPQAGLTESEREKDVYAIYSLMLTNPKTSHGPYNSDRLLIQMTTRPADVQPSCWRPPNEREAEFREVLTDYERRKATPRQLKPLFSISKPYMLLTDDEVRAFSEEQMRPFLWLEMADGSRIEPRGGPVSRRVGLLHAFGRVLQSDRNSGVDRSLILVWRTMRAVSVESIREA